MLAMNPHYEAIGKALVELYYSKFDVADTHKRATELRDLYHETDSLVVFEGNQLQGRAHITEAMGNLPFLNFQHQVRKITCMPLFDGSVLVSVNGHLKTDDDPVQPFSHQFILHQKDDGAFFIKHEIHDLIPHDNQSSQ